jgi:hypothetical protein
MASIKPRHKKAITRTHTHFRGLRWEPTDEQEVVMLFGQLLDHLPESLVIDYIGTVFPDCKATNAETNEDVWIEFELKSSHFFRDHRGRKEKCDWIVCWEDDQPDLPHNAPRIVALNTVVCKKRLKCILNPLTGVTTGREAFLIRIEALSAHHQWIIRRLLRFAERDKGLRVDWPETNGACFTVRELRFLAMETSFLITSRSFLRPIP